MAMRHFCVALCAVLLWYGVAHADPKPIVLSVHDLSVPERGALSMLLARVLTNVFGTNSTRLVTAKVRYHYGNDDDTNASICEPHDVDVPLPGIIYEHQWHGVEELFGKDLATQSLSAVFIGRAAKTDALLFVRLYGPPIISYHQVVGGTLITIAPGQILVYREYTEA
jgi:hypothetical protein